MPFVTGQHQKKAIALAKQKQAKSGKNDKKRKMKTYLVTLKDRSGATYTYTIRTDGTTSMPTLCESKLGATASLPNLGLTSPIQRMLYSRDDLDVKDEKKGGIFSSVIKFFKQKTGKSKSGKSKRKPKTLEQRKRQRTISAMSNLDPIQERPDEEEYEDSDEEDNDSYTHSESDSSSVSESEPNCESVSICESDLKSVEKINIQIKS